MNKLQKQERARKHSKKLLSFRTLEQAKDEIQNA